MSDAWLAATYITVVAVVGLMVTAVVITRGRVVTARASGEQAQKYREVAERAAASEQAVAEELAELTRRVAAVESLLRSVD
ncbi:hypothetical protein [Actinoplanes sp. NPDC051494]|uniref:hypothetical protein n=1 Tax=Actinoplanes sp. NPDC051494 TaxID=3363907 RepID=UPI0037BCC3EF